MKVLVVTEKHNPDQNERDGGERLINTLSSALNTLGATTKIMQFGSKEANAEPLYFEYPFKSADRFKNRLKNAEFIAEKINSVATQFTHILFVHVCMLFGANKLSLPDNIKIITFPMFLSISYGISGEKLPTKYREYERLALSKSDLIITPSHFEKRQLISNYTISREKIRVVPRGVHDLLLKPSVRELKGPLRCCSIGSIKPQKNTLDLVRLFSAIQAEHKNAQLDIIGPIQNINYYQSVVAEIQRLNLSKSITFSGYISPENLAEATTSHHLHITTSHCETFGRSIFETLSMGIPNIVRLGNNAAHDFLEQSPYIKFFNTTNEALESINFTLQNLTPLSIMAREVGLIYDDKLLSKILAAEISHSRFIAVSDFDGTLFHKNCTASTNNCIEQFRRFPTRILCTARPLDNILKKLSDLNLEVDWIISYSGALVSDGLGRIVWSVPLNLVDLNFTITSPDSFEVIRYENQILQISAPDSTPLPSMELRMEVYNKRAFFMRSNASKLHATIGLLNKIGIAGRIRAFGDGLYDHEMITFFDGKLLTPGDRNLNTA